MRVVSTEFLAQTDSLIKFLFLALVIFAVLVLALWVSAETIYDKNQELEEEVKQLQRRIDRLTQQNKTIYK